MVIPKRAHFPPNSNSVVAAARALHAKNRHLQRKNAPKMVPNLTFEIYLLLEKWPIKAINGFVASF